MKIILALTAGLSLGLGGCSSNLYEGLDKDDPVEKSLSYLDQNKPDDAIEVLEEALEDQPSNWTLVSLMGSAKAQKAGVDTTEVALKMATQGETEGNGLTSLFTALPTATRPVVDLLYEAVSYVSSIPDEERVAADNFKLTIYNTAYTALQARLFDGDGDGKFTVDELKNLDDETAVAILDSLLNAESAASAYTAGDSTGTAAAKVADIRAQINAEPGESSPDKLKSFLAKSK